MGNTQYISSYQSTEIVSNVLVSSQNTCINNSTDQQNGNRVIITDHLGDVLIGQKINFDASCVISNNLEVDIINQITQKASNELSEQQSLMASLIGLDLGNSNQTIKAVQTAVVNNKVSEIMNNSCQNISLMQQNNNLVTIKGGTGNITLIQSGNDSANCQMVNVAKTSISTVVDQAMKNSIKLINSLIAIIIAIAVVVGICVIAGIILKMRANSSTKGEDTNLDDEDEQALVDNIKELLANE